MASTGHLWRTTRVNTRKNSTRASVAAVLRAERVRAAQTGAAAAGIVTSLDHPGASAAPRTKRVVAFDDSVTVHLLPADENREAEVARMADDGFCVHCQAFVEDDQRKWKSGFGLGLLRQVDELESKRGFCQCEGSRYPEYGSGGGEVVVYGDDDDDEDEDEADEADEKVEQKDSEVDVDIPVALPAPPPKIQITAKLQNEDHPSPPPLTAQRERALRFPSRSRPRNRGISQDGASPTVSNETQPQRSRMSLSSRPSSDGKSETFFDAVNRESETMRQPLPTQDVNTALVVVSGTDTTVGTTDLTGNKSEYEPRESEQQVQLSVKVQSSRSLPSDPLRISPSLSEIRRQMLDEMEVDDDTSVVQVSPARRNRTLPAPVVRPPRPTLSRGRISSMSDVEMEDRSTLTGSDRAFARIGSTSSTGGIPMLLGDNLVGTCTQVCSLEMLCLAQFTVALQPVNTLSTNH